MKQTQADIESCNKALKTAQSEWTAMGKALGQLWQKGLQHGQGAHRRGQIAQQNSYHARPCYGHGGDQSVAGLRVLVHIRQETVDATEAEFDALASATKPMSTQVAASTTEINETMAIAGQLGIQNDYLVDFTRTMIDLGNSTNIVAEDAASTLAKFANITSMDQAQFGNLGATLVDLGNNFATTEADIMNMSLRLAAAGDQVGLSEAQILGFAAALSSVGVRAEMGGSAFSKALINMEVAAATGGAGVGRFCPRVGHDGGAVQDAVGQRPRRGVPGVHRRTGTDGRGGHLRHRHPAGDRRRGDPPARTHCCAPSMPTSCSPRRRR